MPYNKQDKHCRECICPLCEGFKTDECLEDADGCDKCDNTQHVGRCPWDSNDD